LIEKIYLIDRSVDLVEAWEKEFRNFETVESLNADYFSKEADAMVSPANSFGIMDGGLDDVIRDRLGNSVESNVQTIIEKDYFGELPVGSAIVVSTNRSDWRYLISAPTMRVPEDVSETLNAYYAFRATLNSVRLFNDRNPKKAIRSIICSGFGTGIGGMHPNVCAIQMRLAYESMQQGSSIPSIASIRKSHRDLCRSLV